MKQFIICLLIVISLGAIAQTAPQTTAPGETPAQRDSRMAWWREARFGMFIHWGLYSLLAGEWQGKTDYGEWIRSSAQIPQAEYEALVKRFNPARFDATSWVRLAKQAGMEYIVITSKHHDGFCLFDSACGDFTIAATPYKKDILAELAAACKIEGMRLGWYYSIMDWHHPDYLPRRDWEKTRPIAGAKFDSYLKYMRCQLKELLTRYCAISVLWFDGDWEPSWTAAAGQTLYNAARALQPAIIVNNRIGASQSGDYDTPEQTIPATGAASRDWETCMTMNDHWGYNSHDDNWKSPAELIQKLADCASKGGNFLLNVGPTADGRIPDPSRQRLATIGAWLAVNGEAIRGTSAGPLLRLPWGRCTQRQIAAGTRLYLHVFCWPADGRLVVSGIYNTVQGAFLLADAQKSPLKTGRAGADIAITIPTQAPDAADSVVALDIEGAADLDEPPHIKSDWQQFVDTLAVTIASPRDHVSIHYTLDGSSPTSAAPLATGPLTLTETTLVSARAFREVNPVSPVATRFFYKAKPKPALATPATLAPGLRYAYYEGEYERLPDFPHLAAHTQGVWPNCKLSPRLRNENYALDFSGLIRIPASDVYLFSTVSDDGSALYIDDNCVADNDGLHGMQEASGTIALAAGLHRIRVAYFQKGGNAGLQVYMQSPHLARAPIPDSILFH